MKVTRLFFILFFLLLTVANIPAEITSFTVTPDKNYAEIGEKITITANIVSTEKLTTLNEPTFPKSEHFTLIGKNRNHHQSQSIQVVNGKITQKIEITYVFYYIISFKKEAIVTFPSLTFTQGNKAYQSRPFNITIGKTATKSSNNILASIKCNKKNLYLGEQGLITVEVSEFAQANDIEIPQGAFFMMIESIKNAFTEGFTINQLFTNQLTRVNKTINGRPFIVYGMSFSIIPLKAGKVTIKPIPFQYHQKQRVKSRSVFDDFFGNSFFGTRFQRTAKVIYTNQLILNIQELPPPPDDFSGAVGHFTLSADISKNEVPAGEAVTLTLDLSGSTRPGNLKDIAFPKLKDFEIFTPEKRTFIDTSATGISTRKKFKYLVIPQSEGVKTIPAINWTYFDPQKNSYKTLSTKPITMTIGKGLRGAKKQTRYLTQEDIREVGQDIRYIKTSVSLTHQSSKPYKNPLFFIFYPIPFLLVLFVTLYRLQATFLKKDPAIQLRQKAYIQAKKAAAKVAKQFAQQVSENALSSIAGIIQTYISHRFSFPAVGKTLDELKDELNRQNVSPEVTEALLPFLEKIDSIRFSGIKPDQKTIQELHATSLHLIEGLENKEKKA